MYLTLYITTPNLNKHLYTHSRYCIKTLLTLSSIRFCSLKKGIQLFQTLRLICQILTYQTSSTDIRGSHCGSPLCLPILNICVNLQTNFMISGKLQPQIYSCYLTDIQKAEVEMQLNLATSRPL